jgi:hypothetical protein
VSDRKIKKKVSSKYNLLEIKTCGLGSKIGDVFSE